MTHSTCMWRSYQIKLYSPSEDESEEGDGVDDVERVEDEDEISLRVLAGNTKNLQSRLITIEHFVINAKLTLFLYAETSEEPTALQAMHLSAATATATYPILLRPTHITYVKA